MPDAAAFRIEVADSRLARRLWGFALLAAMLTDGVLLGTYAVLAGGWRLFGAMVSFVVLVVIWCRQGACGHELTISTDGSIRLRAGGGAASAAAVRYCGPMLVCLRGADGNVAVWRDAVPAMAWRRLLVACRWPQQHDSEQSGWSSWHGDRTK